MRMIDIIEKKRDGKSLSKEEIEFFIKGYTEGDIPDYQASSLAMAIFFQDMNEEERAALTMAMVNSGDVIDLSKVNGIKVDKHSTGGTISSCSGSASCQNEWPWFRTYGWYD